MRLRFFISTVKLYLPLLSFGQILINDVLVGRIARSQWRSRAYAVRSVITFSVMASAVLQTLGYMEAGGQSFV